MLARRHAPAPPQGRFKFEPLVCAASRGRSSLMWLTIRRSPYLTGCQFEPLVCAAGWQICHQEDHSRHSRNNKYGNRLRTDSGSSSSCEKLRRSFVRLSSWPNQYGNVCKVPARCNFCRHDEGFSVARSRGLLSSAEMDRQRDGKIMKKIMNSAHFYFPVAACNCHFYHASVDKLRQVVLRSCFKCLIIFLLHKPFSDP
ncbi:hypothetical protein EJB05_16779, partial [Eragrostis curvula]